MKRVSISKNDILKSVYFITAITQKQNSATMQGALSSKGDLMGGIFDRWINTVPESVVFNKLILPDIDESRSTEIISDFYLYDPRTAGIAPDVIGLRTGNKIIPFTIFNEKWISVDGMPQIEIKTFKKPQKMISLRNQAYDDKYLVMSESEFRIDYLLPFFDSNIFAEEIHQNLVMDDSTFIISNLEKKIQGIDKVNLTDETIGDVTLLKITTAKSFMDCATFCEGTVSIQYLTNIEKKNRKPSGAMLNISLENLCDKKEGGLFEFNSRWYEGITDEGIPFYTKNSRGSSNKFLFKTLDLYVENISALSVIKKSNSSIYLEAKDSATINEFCLEKNGIYKIDFSMLDRSSNNGEEYFMQKSLIQYIPDFENQLKHQLKLIINGGY